MPVVHSTHGDSLADVVERVLDKGVWPMDKSLYLYCVCAGSRDEPMEIKGLGGKPVFAVASGEVCAIVQECDSSFSTEDPKLMSEWVLVHQSVVDTAWEKFETIIPFGFGTVIVSKEGRTARENLIDCIAKEGEPLKGKLEKLKGKAEYGVQILWNPTIIAPRVTRNDTEVQRLEEEIRAKSSGTAYLLGQKLERLLSQRMEQAADVYFKEFFQKIRTSVEEIQVGKVKKEEPPRQMLANFSCLLPREDAPKLGERLDGIGQIDGFFVRFTGPWPPYSFVNS